MHRSSSLAPLALGLAFVLTACSGTGGAPIDTSADDAGAPPAAELDASTGVPPSNGDPGSIGAGGDDTSTDPIVDDAGAPAPAVDAGHADASPADAGAHQDASTPAAVNGCTAAMFAANDQSAETFARTISFPNGGDPQAYAPPCMRIARGQAVTWRGRFSDFPLEASGGSKQSPITTTDTGRALIVTFTAPGTYGFVSSAAPTVMRGAIDVKP